MEELLLLVTSFILDVVLRGTGRAVVFLGSFGRWRGEDVVAREGRIHGASGALSFRREGQRVVTSTGLVLAGLLFYAALVAIVVRYWPS
jgi:hypothetical protein